jgi:hypothetical protein
VSEFAVSVDRPIAEKDVAETFDESDVDLTHDKTQVSSESIALGPIEGTTASREADDSSNSVTGRSGVRINPNTSLSGVVASFSSNVSGVTTAYLILDSDGSILDQTDVSDLSSSDTFRLSADLSSGTDYRVVVDADGSSYTDGFYSSPNFPYESTDVDVTYSYYDGSGRGNAVDAISDVTALTGEADSGTAYVEWPGPADVFRWDAATFQAALDSETVEIYIEEAQGSPGWTTIAGPVQRGQEITADPSNRVRFRVELSRSDTANNPRLESIARRWVI